LEQPKNEHSSVSLPLHLDFPFSHTFFHRLHQWTGEKLDHPPPAGFDLDRDGHDVRQIPPPALDLNGEWSYPGEE
jgi:hypothetical protein